MDRRIWTVIGSVVGVIAIAGLLTVLIARKHQADADAEARRANYQRIQSINTSTSYAMDEFHKSTESYDSAQRQGVADSQERHRLWEESPGDIADALSSVRAEERDVQQLAALSQDKVAAARSAATALERYFGDETTSSVFSDITAASDSENKYLADWSRAASTVNDYFTSRINGRWDVADTQDVESLYRASDEDMGVSASRWSGVNSRLSDLQGRLRNALLAAQPDQNGIAIAQATDAQNVIASISPTDLRIATAPPSSLQSPMAPRATAAQPPTRQLQSSSEQGPLATGEVLALLRATPSLTVSSNPDGHTAYVTVPDTPANGTADANRTISGQLADGRWVVFVPLASGSASVGDVYSLMWVWTNGHAQFVGEIPAENNGLGQLSTSLRGGEIYISWPLCCPRTTRTKVLTLDGIRLRPLSDTTS